MDCTGCRLRPAMHRKKRLSEFGSEGVDHRTVFCFLFLLFLLFFCLSYFWSGWGSSSYIYAEEHGCSFRHLGPHFSQPQPQPHENRDECGTQSNVQWQPQKGCAKRITSTENKSSLLCSGQNAIAPTRKPFRGRPCRRLPMAKATRTKPRKADDEKKETSIVCTPHLAQSGGYNEKQNKTDATTKEQTIVVSSPHTRIRSILLSL